MKHLLALSTLALGVLTPAADSQPNQPGATWTDDQLRQAVDVARVGRKLTPKSWPKGCGQIISCSNPPKPPSSNQIPGIAREFSGTRPVAAASSATGPARSGNRKGSPAERGARSGESFWKWTSRAKRRSGAGEGSACLAFPAKDRFSRFVHVVDILQQNYQRWCRM